FRDGAVDDDLPQLTATTVHENADLSAVMTACQDISGEIAVDQVVEKLMVAAVQHTSAERALLILVSGEQPYPKAEAIAQSEGVVVRFCDSMAEPLALPHSMLRTVLQSREFVVIDASTAADRYVLDNRVRSAVCLPLVSRTELLGAMYLEIKNEPR